MIIGHRKYRSYDEVMIKLPWPADLEKAFDKVPYQLLLQKLKLYKVDPSIINEIKAFLCFRKQKPRLNGFFSEWTEDIGGLPQGRIKLTSLS